MEFYNDIQLQQHTSIRIIEIEIQKKNIWLNEMCGSVEKKTNLFVESS